MRDPLDLLKVTEHLACPFCGGKNSNIQILPNKENMYFYAVVCPTCCAVGGPCYSDRQGAWRLWNRRQQAA